jgi:hypothetical protein
MKRSTLEQALWGLASAASVVAILELKRPLPLLSLKLPEAINPPGKPRSFNGSALDAARRDVINGNPFRLARRPAAVAFGAEPAVQAAVAIQPPARPPKPQLRLRGIIGPPWEAILDGMPQRPSGVVVRNGEVIADLQIRRITRDTLVVADADTVWVLTLDRPWR